MSLPVDMVNSIMHGGNGLDAVMGPSWEFGSRVSHVVRNGHLFSGLFGNVPGQPTINPD